MCLCASPLMSTSSFHMYAVIMHLMYPYFSRLQGKIEATIRFGKGIPMPTYYYSDYCRQICIKIFPVTCVTRIIQFIGCCAVCFNIFPFISVFIFFSIHLFVCHLSVYLSIHPIAYRYQVFQIYHMNMWSGIYRQISRDICLYHSLSDIYNR